MDETSSGQKLDLGSTTPLGPNLIAEAANIVTRSVDRFAELKEQKLAVQDTNFLELTVSERQGIAESLNEFELRAMLYSEIGRAAAAEAQVDVLTRRCHDLERRMTFGERHIARVQEETLSKLSTFVQQAVADLAHRERQLLESVREKSSSVEKLEELNSMLSRQAAVLNEQLNTEQVSRQLLQTKFDELERQHATLKASAEKQTRKLEKSDQENATLRKHSTELTEKLEEAFKLLSKSERQLQSKDAELRKMKESVEAKEKSLDRAAQESAKNREQEANAYRHRLEEMTEKRLEQQKQDHAAQLRTLSERLTDAEKQRDRYRQSNRALREELESIETHWNDKENVMRANVQRALAENYNVLASRIGSTSQSARRKKRLSLSTCSTASNNVGAQLDQADFRRRQQLRNFLTTIQSDATVRTQQTSSLAIQPNGRHQQQQQQQQQQNSRQHHRHSPCDHH